MSYDPSAVSGGDGAWTLIESVTVANQASVDLDLTGTHKLFMVHIDNLVPISDNVELWLRFSTDTGSTFLAGTNYSWSLTGGRGATSNFEDAQATSRINLTVVSFGTMGTGTIENLNGFVCIHNANQTTRAVQATVELSMVDATGTMSGWTGGGSLLTNIDEVDTIQLIAESGNLSTGRVNLYGLNLS